MNHNISLIAFDLDGTLLRRGGELSPANLQALEKAHAAGYKLAIATGRTPVSIPPEILRLPYFSYCVSANGAIVFEPENGRMLYENTLDHGTAMGILENASGRGASFRVVLAGKETIDLKGFVRLARYVSVIDNMPPLWRTLLKIKTLFAVTLNTRRTVAKSRKPIHKIVCTYRNEKDFKEQLAHFSRSEKLEVATTFGNELEITASGASKGGALTMIAERFGISMEQVLAFGDSGNDLSMRAAGVLVAMENATDELKAAADYIAPHANEDGVAKMLTELLKL